MLIKAFVREYNLDISTALSFVILNTAKTIEIYPKKSVIAEGSDDDILLLDNNFDINTYCYS